MQGAFKYGWYEYFKKTYSDLAGEENARKYKTGLYLAASASAEFLADIALCPFESIKVRMQGTMPNPYNGTVHGFNTIVGKEGIAGLYKGIYPLWGRQIPYTMMKFASFETIVEMIYDRLPGQKSDYSKAAQTGVSFTGGYLAGILCAVVSHPADVMVSKLNSVREPGEAFGAAMGRIYKDIGFKGLWNGLPMRIVMIGTLTGLQWTIYVSYARESCATEDPSANDYNHRTTSRSSWDSRQPAEVRRLPRRNEMTGKDCEAREWFYVKAQLCSLVFTEITKVCPITVCIWLVNAIVNVRIAAGTDSEYSRACEDDYALLHRCLPSRALATVMAAYQQSMQITASGTAGLEEPTNPNHLVCLIGDYSFFARLLLGGIKR